MSTLHPEDFPESDSFRHVYLQKFDKGLINEKFWELLEQAAEAEENGVKVGGIFRNEVGEVFKGQLRHSSEWLLRAGKSKRLKDLYLCLVAASSENLIDYSSKLSNRKLLKIAEDCSNSGFYYMLRRRQENLFNRRAIINGFAVLTPSDVVCIDNDKQLISEQMLGYVKDGFVQESPSAKGRFHAFVKDSAKVLQQFNVTYGFEVLGGNKQIFFQAVDKKGKLMFPTISGTLDNIGEVSRDISEVLSTSFTYREWYGKSEFDLGAEPTDILFLARDLRHLETIDAKPDFYYQLNGGDKLYFTSKAELDSFEINLKKAEAQARRQVKFDLIDYELPVKSGQQIPLFQNFYPVWSKNKHNRKYMVGERNNCLFKYGRYLRCLGYNESIIEALMAKANNEQCMEPITDKELSGILKSVIKLDNLAGFNQYIPLFSRNYAAEYLLFFQNFFKLRKFSFH